MVVDAGVAEQDKKPRLEQRPRIRAIAPWPLARSGSSISKTGSTLVAIRNAVS
jgi:hypothetical protein